MSVVDIIEILMRQASSHQHQFVVVLPITYT